MPPPHTSHPTGCVRSPLRCLRRAASKWLPGPAAGLRLDHCFAGDGGSARLKDGQLDLSLTSDGRYWVVYTPADADFYCVEPVTHLNNAVQQADPLQHGLVSLDTGAELRLHIRLSGQALPR